MKEIRYFHVELKRRLKLLGLSQEALAKKTYVSQPYISAIINGTKWPSRYVLKSLLLELEFKDYELFDCVGFREKYGIKEIKGEEKSI